MKTLRQTCAVAVLTLLLSVSALAGQINCPGAVSTDTITDITTTVILTAVSLTT